MDIFAKIINKEIEANIIYEDEKIIAFYDIKPKGPGHFLVVPKKHSENLIYINDEDYTYLMLNARKLALKELEKRNLKAFNLIVNNGKEAGQEVFWTHIHIIPKDK